MSFRNTDSMDSSLLASKASGVQVDLDCSTIEHNALVWSNISSIEKDEDRTSLFLRYRIRLSQFLSSQGGLSLMTATSVTLNTRKF